MRDNGNVLYLDCDGGYMTYVTAKLPGLYSKTDEFYIYVNFTSTKLDFKNYGSDNSLVLG